MSADEIVRALRDCGKGKTACSECPYYIENDADECRLAAMHDAANEINHLKAEIFGQADLIESLQAQLAEITAKPELTSPVRYYTDGKPYVQIGGLELRDHPVADACARLDRYEKHIIPHLQTQLSFSLRWEKAAVEDIKHLVFKCADYPLDMCGEVCANSNGICQNGVAAGYGDKCNGFEWRGVKGASDK